MEELQKASELIRYQLFPNGSQHWIFNEKIGSGSMTLQTDGTRVIEVNSTVRERSRASGLDAEQGPIATVSLLLNGTQVYDIWHGPIMWIYINGTQTIDDRGFP